jgi:hypothetical protein
MQVNVYEITVFLLRSWIRIQLLLGHSRNQTHINLRGSATCLLHGATGLY